MLELFNSLSVIYTTILATLIKKEWQLSNKLCESEGALS